MDPDAGRPWLGGLVGGWARLTKSSPNELDSLSDSGIWLSLNRNREGEGGARAVSSGGGSAHVLLMFMLACFSRCACVRCLLRMKMHMGFLLRQYHCPLAMQVVSKKGSHVVQPQSEKVPTRGFSVKKEGVWHDLSSTGADSWIFGEKGSHVA